MFSVNGLVFFRILLLIVGFIISGCAKESSEAPSILAVAIESLNFDSVSCSQNSEDLKAFKILCSESVRFTHAYTPSTLSQAALSSVLTGLYPQRHEVWHNGNSYLKSKYKTVAEVAISKGVRTLFVSGGPPIFSKSGLNQGFEIFNDNFKVGIDNYYRPADKVIKYFLKWLDDLSGNESYFSLLYLADLQFPGVKTLTNEGVERGKSLKSQIQEIDESLYYLIEQLKAEKRWHNTYLVVFGLNGNRFSNRKGVIGPTNLNAEVVQVPLFIKPGQKIRDLGLNWKIDKNVSLVDVGKTLMELLGGLAPSDDKLEISSLVSIFKNPETNWQDDRYILTESAWTQWHGIGSVRFGLRSGQFSMIYDKSPKFYNTLIDRSELSSIGKKDPMFKQFSLPMMSYLEEENLVAWEGVPREKYIRIRVAERLWSHKLGKKGVNWTQGLKSVTKNTEYNKWMALHALENKDWEGLLKLSQRSKNSFWRYIALKNLGRPVAALKGSCGRYLIAKSSKLKPIDLQKCDDPMFSQLVKWVLETSERKKEVEFDKFLRDYMEIIVNRQVSRLNYLNGLTWDVEFIENLEPTNVDYYLALPSSKSLRIKLASRIKKLRSKLK